MAIIRLEGKDYNIKKCDTCPVVINEQTQTNDWFEFALDYYCEINGNKVAGYVEHEWEIPLVLDWCPCLVK